MESTRQQVGTAVFWSVFARSGRFVLGLASSIIVVRGLGEHSYGVLSLVRTVLMFVVILAGAGMGQALLKYLPSLRVERKSKGARELVRRVAFIQSAVWVVLLAACYFCQPLFEQIFAFSSIGRILFIAAGLSTIELYFVLLTQIFNAYYDTKLLSIANILSHVVYIFFLFIFMPLWGVLGVIAAGAAGSFAATAVLLVRASKHFHLAEGSTAEGGIEGTRLLKFSLPFAIIGVLNVVVWRQSETLFLAHFKGAEITGYFDLAYRVPQTMLEFVPGTVWPLIMAGFSETYARDRSSLTAAIEKYYKVLFVLCAPICLYGITLGGSMIPLLFGPDMADAALPTQLFFAIFTVSFFATPLSMSLYVMEKSYANLFVYLLFTIINIGLDLILIPRYGLIGAIIPVGLVIVMSPFIYRLVLSRFLDDIRIPFYFIGKCFAASSPILLIFPFVPFIDSVIEFIVATLVAITLAIFGFRAGHVLGSEEKAILSAVPVPMMGRFLRFMGPR